jgi:phosphatidylglycerophosphate synthase
MLFTEILAEVAAPATFADSLAKGLEPVASIFRDMNLPDVITHWGHPFFMGIVVVMMGSFVAITGWKSRIAEDGEAKTKLRMDHRKVAPLMTAFLITGYSGGLLSLVIQHKPVLESPHFITGSLVVTLLLINGSISFLGFKNGEAKGARTAHAYIGSAIALLLVVHAGLGLALGLSI